MWFAMFPFILPSNISLKSSSCPNIFPIHLFFCNTSRLVICQYSRSSDQSTRTSHPPHLEQILSTVDLIIGADYRDDTIVRSFVWVGNRYWCTGLLANLLDSWSTFSNDESSQLRHSNRFGLQLPPELNNNDNNSNSV